MEHMEQILPHVVLAHLHHAISSIVHQGRSVSKRLALNSDPSCGEMRLMADPPLMEAHARCCLVIGHRARPFRLGRQLPSADSGSSLAGSDVIRVVG